jgi:competence protein ComEC
MSVSEIAALGVRPSVDVRMSANSFSARKAVAWQLGRQPRYLPLITVLAAGCAGIIVDRMALPIVPQSFGTWWLLAASSLISWLVFWLKRREKAAMGAVLVSVAAIAGAWHHQCWNLFGEDEIGLSATETALPICIEAIVAEPPRDVPAPSFDPLRSLPSGSQTRLLVDAVAVHDGAEWQPASGRAQVSIAGPVAEVEVGDRLRIFGLVEAPMPAGNPGEFDSALFDRSKRELSVIRVKMPECIQVVEQGSAWSPARWISQLREAGDQLLWNYLSKDRAGMAAAVLLGEREEVDHETNEAFMETGTIHILCIAGLHMAILAWALFMIFGAGWLPRRVALVCVMAVTGFYMLLTAAEPPVMRATLLVWIVCGGMLWGRNRIGLNSLALAGLVVLAVNPAGLFHTGVQLSFLSVAVLVCAGESFFGGWQADPLDRLIAASRPWPERAVRRMGTHVVEVFVLGAALWLAITPLTMARFHLLAPAALVLNVLLLPVLPVAMLAGLGVLVFGAWLPPVARGCAWVCNGSLNVIDGAVKWFAHLPGGRFWVAGPSEAWLIVFYLTLAAILLSSFWLPPLRWRIALLTGLCGIGLLGALPASGGHGRALRCDFIAVGHGGAELLELPNGKTLLYDAGRMGAPLGGARSISAFLWSRGITHLDAVVISHADTDHYNSLPELLQRFSVGVVYESPEMFQQKSRALNILKSSIEESGTPLKLVYAGDRLEAGDGVTIDVLHPPPEGVVGTDNANCVVLSVEYCGKRILLTGDLAPPGMEMVMNGEPVAYDVLQAPHHGSTYSEPENFAGWTTPKFAIICGSNTDGRIAGPIYASHGATVMNTAEYGAVTVTIDAGGLNIETFRQPPAASAK